MVRSVEKTRKVRLIIFLYSFLFLSLIFLFTNNGLSANAKEQDVNLLIQALSRNHVNLSKITFQQGGVVKHYQTVSQILAMKKAIEQNFNLSLMDISGIEDEKGVIRYQGQRNLSTNRHLQIAWIGQKESGNPSGMLYHAFFIVEISSSSNISGRMILDI